MSEFAEKIKKYYDLGLWNEHRLRAAVSKNAITPDEFRAITGKDYSVNQ